MRSVILFVAIVMSPISANAGETTTKYMRFDDCIKTIQNVSTQLGVTPVNIVETSIIRMVRFYTSDGNVLITCSKPDNKMVITRND